MSEKGGYHCKIQGKWILIWKLMMMGTLSEVLEVKAGCANLLPIEAEQLIHLPRRTPKENLMVGLIKEFANLQNVTQITACLPIPRAVGEPVPRGILTTNLGSEKSNNDGTYCEQVPVVEWQERIDYVKKQWKTPGNRADCEKLLNYVFVKIGRFHNVGWCTYDEPVKKNVSQTIMEWECRKSNQTKQEITSWDSVWSMAISSQFQYMANAPWCFTWGGMIFAAFPSVNDKGSTSREKEIIVPWWNCTKIVVQLVKQSKAFHLWQLH